MKGRTTQTEHAPTSSSINVVYAGFDKYAYICFNGIPVERRSNVVKSLVDAAMSCGSSACDDTPAQMLVFFVARYP